jgi:plastocyanin
MSEEAKERTMKDDTKALAWYRRALVAAGVMALLIGAHALAATPPRIEIKDFKYGPPILSVPVGSTLTWVNHDEEPHTVTSATGAFTSAGLVHDDTFMETFTKPGTYEYFCKVHPFMKGTVVVK